MFVVMIKIICENHDDDDDDDDQNDGDVNYDYDCNDDDDDDDDDKSEKRMGFHHILRIAQMFRCLIEFPKCKMLGRLNYPPSMGK